MIDDSVVRQRAEEFIRDHAQDIEWLTINEAMDYHEWPEVENLTLYGEEAYARRIDEAIRLAKIIITWE